MPKALERKLRMEAIRKGLGRERQDRYVYGALRKMGWKPKKQRHHEHRRKK